MATPAVWLSSWQEKEKTEKITDDTRAFLLWFHVTATQPFTQGNHFLRHQNLSATTPPMENKLTRHSGCQHFSYTLLPMPLSECDCYTFCPLEGSLKLLIATYLQSLVAVSIQCVSLRDVNLSQLATANCGSSEPWAWNASRRVRCDTKTESTSPSTHTHTSLIYGLSPPTGVTYLFKHLQLCHLDRRFCQTHFCGQNEQRKKILV